MKTQLSNFTILKKTFQTLIASRIKPFYWVDEEKESEQETLAYKAIQAINALFYAKKIYPQLLGKFKINGKFIYEEIVNFNNVFKKEGFYPSPYLYVREITDYTDFACDSIKLLIEIQNSIHKKAFKLVKKDIEKLNEICSNVIDKGLKLIVSSVFIDKDGARWETILYETQKKPQYANVYSTSMSIKCLSSYLKYNTKSKINIKEEYTELIKQGFEWIFNRQKDGLIAGDEKRTKMEINHSIYALSAIIEAWEYLTEEHQEKARNLFNLICTYMIENYKDIQYQNFMEVYLPQLKKNIYYDDRLTVGMILSTLTRGKTLFKDVAIDPVKFTNLINEMARELLDSYNYQNNYWKKDNYFIGDTCDSIMGLIDYDLHGTPLEYNLTEYEILEILNKTLKRSEIRSMFLAELTKYQTKRFTTEFVEGKK